MKPLVVTQIVDNDLCIGCGACAGICSQGVLEMQWNQYGEYNPVEISPCTTECGLCLNVCPFADHEENEDTIGKELFGSVTGIKHRPETGYYLASYVGYSEKHRLSSASGGVATWLLEEMLTQGIVDHVVFVAPTDDPRNLFEFRVFDTPEDVRSGAGSAYYPVEMSGVIRHIIETPGRYAVTGLPCFIKAIRLAQKRNKNLRERIVVNVGLTCGQLKSRHFTEYIASLAGVQGEVTSVRYRGKSPDHPATNYHYSFTTEDGEEYRIFWKEGIAEAWTNRWFTPNACNYCDDVFAECADVTCMDAWLPEYSGDSRGTSLVLVRSPFVQDLIAEGIKRKEVNLDPIQAEKIVQSQAGVTICKRQHLAHRLYNAQKKGGEVPDKRIPPKKLINPITISEISLKEQMQITSRMNWTLYSNFNTQSLRRTMKPLIKKLNNENKVKRTMQLPISSVRYIRRKIRSVRHE